ncbi:Acetyltransferase (GNAT) domain-containing protein [Formosa sp. Hel1_31_208]|uniref:GNAT family N-acetyltransferase n=1 Tax=Formosa sp. Hel1_31_208 TaxID=1798225 RepID=UPI00087AF380|nr:GNAT family N-acetyltransferase [Formosa sp. Hel1_31_208]SDS38571.1 Acetyltransferase (GNAT) domain-containing protein [Formosa sp. Hel1_31_208]
MKTNPYTSHTFENIWTQHYCKGKTVHSFEFFQNIKFSKTKKWPIYVNLGKNFTNGMNYSVDAKKRDFKGKVALIYDVPSFYDINFPEHHQIKLKKVKQYDGFYGDLSGFNTIDDVILANFSSSKSRYNFRRSLKQLHETADLQWTVYYGSIEKETYHREMAVFKSLLNKRFDDKNVFNTVLPMWAFFKDLIYEMIIEKRVVMNVLYNGTEPIAMSINFVSEDSISVAIRTFDIDYNKLNIGNIEIYKLIEWCLANDIKIIDFSKGENYYKKRWTDTQYHYDFHIIYDSKSLVSRLLGNILVRFFKFKQYLRDKNVNSLYVKLKHFKKRLLRQS